ncbi:MAG: uncharacterized protein KVP18_004360 [Porospora cf. gigantea A]|uniref:uncharacterized protein n=1 Tax=Porospora cf. gigantea A TaxID=2853593 RepID=UPI0035597E7D|nr:MAG: hypothetical protein KVP18_004360 [Porospora cf. gigantea A]
MWTSDTLHAGWTSGISSSNELLVLNNILSECSTLDESVAKTKPLARFISKTPFGERGLPFRQREIRIHVQLPTDDTAFAHILKEHGLQHLPCWHVVLLTSTGQDYLGYVIASHSVGLYQVFGRKGELRFDIRGKKLQQGMLGWLLSFSATQRAVVYDVLQPGHSEPVCQLKRLGSGFLGVPGKLQKNENNLVLTFLKAGPPTDRLLIVIAGLFIGYCHSY